MFAVAEGQVDVAFVASALALPEGLGRQEAGDIRWATFARSDRPAIPSWGAAVWASWPHVVVQVGNSLQSPVTAAAGDADTQAPHRCARPEFFRCCSVVGAHRPSRHAAGDRDARSAEAIRTACASTAISSEGDAAPLRVEPAAQQRSGRSMDQGNHRRVLRGSAPRLRGENVVSAFDEAAACEETRTRPTIRLRLPDPREGRVSFHRSRH